MPGRNEAFRRGQTLAWFLKVRATDELSLRQPRKERGRYAEGRAASTGLGGGPSEEATPTLRPKLKLGDWHRLGTYCHVKHRRANRNYASVQKAGREPHAASERS